MNELYKKRRGTSQMSEQFGPNFAQGSFALQQSIRLVYTLRALSRGRNRATRATRDNQDAQTQKEHTRSATETQHNSQPETPKGSWPLLLCCCCAAAVLTRDASRSTTRLNRLFLVLCFMERTQERVTAQQQQQQVQQQERPKHTYEYTTRHQAG